MTERGAVAEMLKIGEFSKISRVSIKTLRYYDAIGLLRELTRITGEDKFNSPWSSRTTITRCGCGGVPRLVGQPLDIGTISRCHWGFTFVSLIFVSSTGHPIGCLSISLYL